MTLAIPTDVIEKLRVIAEHEDRGINKQAARLLRMAVEQTHARITA